MYNKFLILVQFAVEPQDSVMRLDGRTLEPGAMLGPFIEGQTVVLECASSQGRPASSVSTLTLNVFSYTLPHSTNLISVE